MGEEIEKRSKKSLKRKAEARVEIELEETLSKSLVLLRG